MILAFANNKGGVGKTTTSLNIGFGLSYLKKKILLIDMDPQTNLTTGMGFYDNPKLSIYNTLMGECSLNEAAIKVNKYLSLIPAVIDLSVLEFDHTVKIQSSLSKLLSNYQEHYDHIIIDTPPGFGSLSINSILACERVFIPVLPDFFSYQGLSQFIAVVHQINPLIEVGGIIITHFDKRKVISRDFFTGIGNNFSKYLLKTQIRENVAIAESLAQGKDVFSYNPKSNGAIDYAALSKEISKIISRF